MAGASIQDMRLQHNQIQTLEGSVFVNMKELQRLNLSYNALGPTIGLRELRGLDNLRVLDLSYNLLTTLEDTSEVRMHYASCMACIIASTTESERTIDTFLLKSKENFKGASGAENAAKLNKLCLANVEKCECSVFL